jgi:hypothetical protein
VNGSLRFQHQVLPQQGLRYAGRPHSLNNNPMFDVASAIAYLEMTLEVLEQMQRAVERPSGVFRRPLDPMSPANSAQRD